MRCSARPCSPRQEPLLLRYRPHFAVGVDHDLVVGPSAAPAMGVPFLLPTAWSADQDRVHVDVPAAQSALPPEVRDSVDRWGCCSCVGTALTGIQGDVLQQEVDVVPGALPVGLGEHPNRVIEPSAVC